MHRSFFISSAACLALASPVAAESRFCRDAFDTVKDELEDYSRNGKISNRDLREIRDEIGDRALACNGVQLLLGAANDDDLKRDSGKKNKNRDDAFCEDVIEDIQDELEDFAKDDKKGQSTRAAFIRYILKDLDRDEKRCAQLVFDTEPDVSPSKATNTWNKSFYSARVTN
ncbi:MAG: hypothetical protein EBU18_13320 [Rhodobacteraceae bacterium]|nr:hypothetical protein [Paracoccaceae bacterium]